MPPRLVLDTERLPSSSRYRLLVRLASGGMATVFIGQLTSAAGFTRLVAVKRAHAHLLDQRGFREGFAEEAKLASLLRHRNVVSVTDVEDTGHDLLMVMDYVDGGALSDLLQDSTEEGAPPLSPPVAVRIVTDACAGLEAAHALAGADGAALGLVHRDVSPHNILVGSDGAVYLTDFGIAKAVHSQSHTETGALKGKLAYMAPEYVRGEGASQCSDVFSMGVVLWEALTGRRLFAGASEIITMQNVMSLEPAPPVSSIAPIDAALEEIVARALAKQPEDRFSDGRALRVALERYASEPGRVCTPSEVASAVASRLASSLATRKELLRAACGELLPEHDAAALAPAELPDSPRTETLPLRKPPQSDRVVAGPVGTMHDVTSATGLSVRANVPNAPSRASRTLVLTLATLGTLLALAIGGMGSSSWWGQRTSEPLARLSAAQASAPSPAPTASTPTSTTASTPASGLELAVTNATAEPPPSSVASTVGRATVAAARVQTSSRTVPPLPSATPTASAAPPPSTSAPAWVVCNPYKTPPDPSCPGGRP